MILTILNSKLRNRDSDLLVKAVEYVVIGILGKVGVSIQSFMLHHHGRVGTLLKSPDAKEKVLCTSMVTERDFEVEFVLTILLREFICPYSLPLSSLTHLNISCVLRFPLPLLGVHPPISSAQTLPLFAH